jgi:4-hydroxy-tetrahydrodipicolinate reductase
LTPTEKFAPNTNAPCFSSTRFLIVSFSAFQPVVPSTSGTFATRNARACLAARVPLVEGTTGWNAQKETIKNLVEAEQGAFVFGANFSVGVNLFYRITNFAAELFAKFDDYETFIEERHHSRKKDAPSGTALKLKETVAKHIAKDFSVSATRAGNIPGTHTVGFDSAADTIELTHTARSREGFAAGAILAAEWIAGKKGFYEFTDVMDEILKEF